MRIIVVLILSLAGLAGLAPAGAADLGNGNGNGNGYAFAEPAQPDIVFDFQPGVVIRAYWLAPWAGRHYYPSGGRMPAIGRDEVLPPATISAPAKNFSRQWSTVAPEPLTQPPPVVFAPQQNNLPGLVVPPPAGK